MAIDPASLSDAEVRREAQAILQFVRTRVKERGGQLSPGILAAINEVIGDTDLATEMFATLVRQGKKAPGGYLTIKEPEVAMRASTSGSAEVLKLLRETFPGFVDNFCRTQAGVAA